MNIVRMTHIYGACCMTGELCSFTALADDWLERKKHYYPKFTETQLLMNCFGADCSSLLQDGQMQVRDHFYGKGETVEEAWQNALKQVQISVNRYRYAGKQVRYFWFVRHEGSDGYKNEPLRAIVQAIPNVVKLGNYVNANSRNEVDGYMVVFTNESGGMDIEDEDNE